MQPSHTRFDAMIEMCRSHPSSSENIRLLLREARSREERARAVELFEGIGRPDATIHAKVRLCVSDLLEGFNAPESAARWRDPAPRSIN